MISNKSILALGAVALMSSASFVGAAFAADMAMAPQPYYAPPAPPQEDFGGWYLRGDIGQTNSRARLDNAAYTTTLANARVDKLGHSLSGGTSYGLGVGYQFNSWFRGDITGEYRSKVNFSGVDFVAFPGNGGYQSNTYTGGYSSWVGLVNAYVDLGTWWCITPFIGAGVGAANITTTGFQDAGISSVGPSSSQFADGASKTNLAWAAHAGLAYKVNNNFTVELAYRYLDMGTAAHGYSRAYAPGGFAGQSSFEYKDITSHDVKIGVRWNLDTPAPAAYAPPPPLIRKG